MAVVTNTFTRYNSIGIRESLSDIVENISPTSTPFLSNMSKKTTVRNTFFEWQT